MPEGRRQPARGSERTERIDTPMETRAFANRRDKRRKKNALAKAARRKNRG